MTTTTTERFLDTVLNLSRYHREHEKFHAQAPLESAIELQRAARPTNAAVAKPSQ